MTVGANMKLKVEIFFIALTSRFQSQRLGFPRPKR
jgi:hypothetical protein